MASADSPPSARNTVDPNTPDLTRKSSLCTPRCLPADSRAMPPSLAMAGSSESTSGFSVVPVLGGAGGFGIASSSVILPVRNAQARYTGSFISSRRTCISVCRRSAADSRFRRATSRPRAFASHCMSRRPRAWRSCTASCVACAFCCWYSAHSACVMPACSAVSNDGIMPRACSAITISSPLASMRSITPRTAGVSSTLRFFSSR